MTCNYVPRPYSSLRILEWVDTTDARLVATGATTEAKGIAMSLVMEKQHCSVANQIMEGTGQVVQVVEIFGASGFQMPNRDEWAISSSRSATGFKAIPARPKAVKLIEDLMPYNHLRSQVRMAKVVPRFAVMLFLEQILTVPMLRAAIEGGDHIDIPAVKIGSQEMTVRVVNMALVSALLLADAKGGVLINSGIPHDRLDE